MDGIRIQPTLTHVKIIDADLCEDTTDFFPPSTTIFPPRVNPLLWIPSVAYPVTAFSLRNLQLSLSDSLTVSPTYVFADTLAGLLKNDIVLKSGGDWAVVVCRRG